MAFPPFAIFDIDGTLVDSRRTIARAMDAAFDALGLAPPGFDGTRHVVGLSLDEACARLAPASLDAAGLARLVAAYKEAFVRHRGEPDHIEPLYEGALATLERLAGEGWLIGAATGKARRGVQAVFNAHPIGRYFDTVWCADDGPGKPHPFMVEEAMRSVGAPVAATVLIGDTSHDMAMARAAGVAALGVSWGFHEPHEIEAGGAHAVHHDFDALNAALDDFAAARGQTA